MGDTAELQPSTGPTADPSPAGMTIELTTTPVLSYALAHSGVPVLSRLALTSDVPVPAATVRMTVADAGGPIGPPVELQVDLDAGRTTVVNDVGLTLDPAAMLRVEERRPGWIRVDVESQGRVLAQRRTPVHALAPAQWLATPVGLALEMLATHVQPQDPAIDGLLADAAVLLAERTGDPSTRGSRAEPERIDQIVAALAESMRRRAIGHLEPPASWGHIGQRVRTPDAVLDDGAGTCLDTTVVLAAACERAGIRPLLWLVEGSGGRTGDSHAFLGYWREEGCADTAATTDVTTLVSSVDLGRIRLVETTLLTDRGRISDDLHRRPYAAWLTGDRGRVLGVTDVHRARANGIVPLPGRVGEVEDTGSVIDPSAPGVLAGQPARLQQWQDALLDLSERNLLIDGIGSRGLSLTVPAQALPDLAALVQSGSPITLLPSDRLSVPVRERRPRTATELPAEQLTELLTGRRTVHADVPDAGYVSRLRDLAHQARTRLEETGANDLHLALGTLVWELDGRPVRSPLLLVPVTLTAASARGGYRLALDGSGASVPNGTLLEKLRRLHGLTVPGLADPGADGAGLDLAAAFGAVRTALAQQGLPFRIEETAHLAVLRVADHRKWADLEQHWPDFAAGPLVASLVRGPGQSFTDPVPDTAGDVDLDELAARCPAPADAAQLRAVAEAAAGRTFVLEGPPGTGKSQTITNLLAQAAADGKRVLFVAGKQTALDVVSRRLDAVGMGPFALDLHRQGSRPAAVRAQVRAALQHAVEVDAELLAADGADLRSTRHRLASYADRLHATNGAGVSFYSARTGALSAGTDVPALPMPAAFVAAATDETTTTVRHALALLPDIADRARPSTGHAWAFVDTVHLDVAAVQRAAVEVDRVVRELPGEGPLAAVVRAARTPDHLDTLAHLLSGPRISLEVLDEVRTDRWSAAAALVTAEVAGLAGTAHPGFDVATPAALGLPLGQLFVDAQAAAASTWLARRRKLAAVRAALAPALRPGAKVRRRDVPELTAALRRVQSAVHTAARHATAVPGLRVPATWNPFLDSGRFLLDAEVSWLRRCAAAVDAEAPGSDAFAVALRRFLSAGPVADVAAADLIGRLRDAVSSLMTACSSSSAQLSAWSGGDGFVLRWTMTRPERGVEYADPMSLRRWVSLLDTLEPLRAAGLTEARRALLAGTIRADDAVRSFQRALAEVSATERSQATGLADFDAGLHERTVTRFTEVARAVRGHLVAALPAGVLAARPVDVADNAEVAALQEALADSPGSPGLRELFSAYGELITAVLPCVLATPDTVARFLPAVPGLFDLVVLDEASQLQIADAVGALGRARAAVVVGDSRQLPPSGPDSGAGSGMTEVESVLAACLRAGVPSHELTWHYRSRDESLIAFSNARYYGNRLSSFPAPSSGSGAARPEGRGVSLVQVGGTFQRSGTAKLLATNPVEASVLVSEVLRRFDASPDALPSIGVITLGAAQRAHIEELLRDCGDDRVVQALDRTDGEGLFVKQLEHVQGDERDAVFLSTCISPTARGHVPLDLGPLSRAGGERRLNVAITRARQQVLVFSSFAPEQLRAEETASAGVRHLRAYLDLAARGVEALPRRVQPAGAVDGHREDVAAAVRARGLVVRTDVGLSDFRIDLTVARAAAPDSPVLAVLLDGPAWARRRTVGDRDGLPVEVLTRLLSWPAVERVWLPAWLADRDAVVDRLVAAVEATTPPSPAGPGMRRPPRRPAGRPASSPAPLPRSPRATAPAARVGGNQASAAPTSGGIPVQGRPVRPGAQPVASVHARQTSSAATVAVPGGAGAAAPVAARPVAVHSGAGQALAAHPGTVQPADPPALRLVPTPPVLRLVTSAPIADIETTADAAPAQPSAAAPSTTAATTRVSRPARTTAKPAAARLDGERPFAAWTPKPAGEKKLLDSLADPKAARAVRRVLTAGVRAEGPVHYDRLVRIAAAAFGLTRVTAARRAALLALLSQDAVVGEFVWPADVDPATWRGFRRSAASGDRPLEHVAPEEIGNAMAALCRADGGLARDALHLRTLGVFGYRRRTPALLPLLDAALAGALADGRLTEQPTGLFTC